MAEDPRVQPLELGIRIDAELLGEQLLPLQVGVDGLRLTAQPIEGEHQLCAQPLAQSRAGISSARLVRYKRPPTLAEALAGNVRVPGVSVSLPDLEELTTPRLMAIWRGR